MGSTSSLCLAASLALIASCNARKPIDLSPEAAALAVTPEEMPKECQYSWKTARPIVASAKEASGRQYAEVVLGFWFGKGQAPLDDIEYFVSNLFATPTDDYAVTMVVIAFLDDNKAKAASAVLNYRSQGRPVSISDSGKFVTIFVAKSSVSSPCSAAAHELQVKKVELAWR